MKKEIKTLDDLIPYLIKLEGNYIDINDVCELLDIHYETVRKRIESGKLRGSKKYSLLIPFDYVVAELITKNNDIQDEEL